MAIKFFSMQPVEDSPSYEEYLNKAKMQIQDAKNRYLPAVETVSKEHKKLAPHIKRLGAVYQSLDPVVQQKLGVGGAVLTTGATAIGLGLRMNHSTVDELIDQPNSI